MLVLPQHQGCALQRCRSLHSLPTCVPPSTQRLRSTEAQLQSPGAHALDAPSSGMRNKKKVGVRRSCPNCRMHPRLVLHSCLLIYMHPVSAPMPGDTHAPSQCTHVW